MQTTNRVVNPLRTLNLSSSSPDTPRVSVMHVEGQKNTQPSRPHVHSFFELFLVEDGEGWHRIDDRQVWAKPGDLFLITPGEVHDPSGLDNATKWVIAFGLDALYPTRSDADVFLMLPSELLLFSFLRTEDKEARCFRIPPETRLRWFGQLRQLESELDDKPVGFTEAARAILMLLMIDLARLSTGQLKKQPVQSRPVLTKVFRFIEANYHDQIGLNEVAKEVNLSPAYLTDLVRRETGRSVHKWIVERRMAQARCLLLETDESVNQIAEKVGYFDTGHFIRLFRRFNGTTPQAWRLSQRG